MIGHKCTECGGELTGYELGGEICEQCQQAALKYFLDILDDSEKLKSEAGGFISKQNLTGAVTFKPIT